MVKLNTPSKKVILNGQPITEYAGADFKPRRLIKNKSSEEVTVLSFKDKNNRSVEHYIEGKPANVKQNIGEKRVDYAQNKRRRDPMALIRLILAAAIFGTVLVSIII